MTNISLGDPVARERHQTLDFIGLRAHATTVGLIQLCEELLVSGVLKPEGLERIKSAIRSELTVSNSRISNQANFAETLKQRIDAIFPKDATHLEKAHVGPTEEFEDAMESYHGA